MTETTFDIAGTAPAPARDRHMQNSSDRRQTEGARPLAWETEKDLRPITVLDSAQLFADRREVRIRHRGECYRLLMTKNGRLILNK